MSVPVVLCALRPARCVRRVGRVGRVGRRADTRIGRRRPARSTIRLASPFNAGGAIDVLNRVIAEKLSQRLGQQV